MEGDGGVVAVVQRLQDAGLAVTLMARFSGARDRTLGTKAPSQASQTVVDTGTETAFGQNPPRNVGLRTSYQVAHCRPSASPVRLPQYSTERFLQYRSSTSRSHDEEVFVDSLRKYPYISPNRSRSADLIQRMITYTQKKNSSKYANSRSAKSLPSKEGTDRIPSDEIPTRDTGMATVETRPNFGYKRDGELIPAPTCKRKSRCDNQIGMYDYLSGRKDKKLKGPEVRYLTTMKQCLKERLKQMCEGSSAEVCSKMQNRYIQHRKQYHKSDTSPSPKCPGCRNKSQASSPSDIQTARTSKDRSKEIQSFKNHKACFCNRPSPCDCTTSGSFLELRIPTDDLTSEGNTCKQCPDSKSICSYECNRIENVAEQKLEETVLDWVQELPVHAKFSTRDRMKREEMINQLIETLKQLQKGDDFLEKAEQEIKKCLKGLPMWRPENKQDQERFDNQLANSLLERLKNLDSDSSKFENEIAKWLNSIKFIRCVDKKKIVQDLNHKVKAVAAARPSSDQQYKKALKSSIVKTLNELPIDVSGYRVTFINDLAEKLAENLILIPLDESSKQPDLKSIVLDWVKNIPEFSRDDQLNSEDYALVNDLITKLNNLQSQGGDNEKQMHNEITNWLNSVEGKKQCRIDRKTKQLLINQLLEKITPPTVKDVVQKWFEGLPDVFGVDILDYKADLEMLGTKLEELQSIEDDGNRQSSMRKEVLNWLKKIQKKRGKYIDNGTEENLVNKLINMMRNKSRTINGMGDENDLITQKIWDWLKCQPEFQHDIASNYRNMVTELSENLQDIIVQKGELTKDDVKAVLINWFEKLNKKHNLKIDTKNRKMLEDQILSTIHKDASERSNWKKPESILKTVKKEVDSIFDDPTIRLNEKDKVRLKDQITKVLTRDWNAIHSTQTDKPLSEIKSILKNETNLPDEKINSLAQTLIKKVKAATLSYLVDTVQEVLILDRPLKEKLRSKVDSILKTLPIKNKGVLVDKITDTLEQIYKEGNDNAYETIYDTLINLNLTESEAADLTDKILDMSNTFRHEVKESGLDTTYSNYESMESLWVQKQMFMQRLEREITDFMEKVLNESSSFFRENPPDAIASIPGDDTTNNYNQFKMPPLKTSTPRSGSVDNAVKNEKEMKSTKLTAVHVNVEIDKRPGTSESEYKQQIEGKIRMWISSLELDSKIDNKYKDNMAKDIANDIIDRQRYIQLSKLKTSSQEELEHLKYQVFKWTSKLPDQNNLSASTSKIKMLMKSLEVEKVPNLIGGTKKQDAATENPIIIISQDTSELIEDNIFSAILNWIRKMPLLKPKKSQENQLDNLIDELSVKLKNILSVDSSKDGTNIETACKQEIIIFLRKLNPEQKLTEDLIQKTANELLNYLKTMQFFVDVIERLQGVSKELENDSKKKEAIKIAVQNWCRKLTLKKGTSYEDIKETVDKLADAISQYLTITDIDNLNKFMDDFLNNFNQQLDKEDNRNLPEFAERLIETIKNVLSDKLKYNNASKDLTIPKQKKAVEVMYDNIQSWCENLPIDLDTSEDIEKANAIKQNIASKLIKKVGELNLDPELFHDDFLYEDVLKDEIDQILDTLPKSPKLEKILPALKEDLVKKIIKSKEEMKDELAGYAYKQKLRDAISKTLSSVGLPVTEDTSLDVLKDNLADAFINLHYVADDAELKRKFKDKIYNEVNKFCNDYLKRYPSSPLNATQLNRDLYDALKKVPMPKDESMRREVEQIRMKDVVTDWFKDLSLEKAPSRVQENKIITVLAKRLHEIEKEADFDQSIDADEMMQNEIFKWLKKFNLKFKGKTQDVARKLMNKLKNTKHSRKLDETTTRKSINYADLTSDLEEGAFSQVSKTVTDSNSTKENPTVRQNIVKNTIKQSKTVTESNLAKENPPVQQNVVKNTIRQSKTVTESNSTKEIPPVQQNIVKNTIRESKTVTESNSTKEIPPVQQNIVNNTIRQFTYPPSGLSDDDRAHLQRIKDRALERTILKPDDKKDAAVSPPPVPAAIQTEPPTNINISQKVSQNASIQTLTREPEPYPITPQVIIKEYYWDSSRSPPMQRDSTLSISRPPATATDKQQVKTSQGNSRVVTASQTLPLPTTSKCTGTQKAAIKQVAENQAQTSNPTSLTNQLIIQEASSNVQEETLFRPEDNLHLNTKRKSYGRVDLPSNIDTPEVGTSNVSEDIQQKEEQRNDAPNCRTDCRSGVLNDARWEVPNRICHQPCFRRRMYHTPTTTIELDQTPKRKRRNQQCSCKNHTVPKCTIRPSDMSCQCSHKPLKYCTKCWDGYCPHPSYLYFKRD